MSNYFIIRGTEDGIKINQLSKKELLERITPDENGEHYYGDKELKFLDYIPAIEDGYFNEYGIVIIKGDIVIPESKIIVKTYSID